MRLLSLFLVVEVVVAVAVAAVADAAAADAAANVMLVWGHLDC